MNRRRFVAAAGGGIAATMLPTSAKASNVEIDPTVEFGDDNLRVVVRGIEGAPEDYGDEIAGGYEEIVLHTADGSSFEFTDDRKFWDSLSYSFQFLGGYLNDDHHRMWGIPTNEWHGVLERIDLHHGDQVVTEENDHDSTLEVTPSLWRNPDTAPNDMVIEYDDGSSKTYSPPAGPDPVYGSPGRRIDTVRERDPDRLDISFYGSDDVVIRRSGPESESEQPEEPKAVTFDCTSVTIEPEEFVNGRPEIHDSELVFVDGSTREITHDEPQEPPATYVGTGDHEGKAIETLRFGNDPDGDTEFVYRNPDAETREPGGDEEDPESEYNRLEVASTDETPSMHYEFSADGEIVGGDDLTENDRVVEDGEASRVEGQVGPRGTDTYYVESDSIRSFAAYHLHGWPDDPNYSEDPVDESRFDLLWNGERVDSREISSNPDGSESDEGSEETPEEPSDGTPDEASESTTEADADEASTDTTETSSTGGDDAGSENGSDSASASADTPASTDTSTEPTAEPTGNGGETTSSNDTRSETNDGALLRSDPDDQPGMGVFAGLAGLLGAGEVLRRRHSGNGDERRSDRDH